MRLTNSARLAWVLVAAVATMPAQTATGNIIGHVTDATGAITPGVEVTVLNPATGITARVVVDEQGIYRAFYLAPGSSA